MITIERTVDLHGAHSATDREYLLLASIRSMLREMLKRLKVDIELNQLGVVDNTITLSLDQLTKQGDQEAEKTRRAKSVAAELDANRSIRWNNDFYS